tara:strand:- start:256 stop:465 length:210 start_codon:yes stop_codon:yes gene_type:complete
MDRILIKEIKDELDGLNKLLVKLKNDINDEHLGIKKIDYDTKLSNAKNLIRIAHVTAAKLKYYTSFGDK